MHECEQVTRIQDLESDVAVLKSSDENMNSRLVRMEDKLDKILYFIMGGVASLCISLLVLLL